MLQDRGPPNHEKLATAHCCGEAYMHSKANNANEGKGEMRRQRRPKTQLRPVEIWYSLMCKSEVQKVKQANGN